VTVNLLQDLVFSLLLNGRMLHFVTDDCGKEERVKCQNGACLDSQCHCNDGFGGCGCEVPGKCEVTVRQELLATVSGQLSTAG
jgi:hypothetical protein